MSRPEDDARRAGTIVPEQEEAEEKGPFDSGRLCQTIDSSRPSFMSPTKSSKMKTVAEKLLLDSLLVDSKSGHKQAANVAASINVD